MDFVEWCGFVLDRLAGETQASTHVLINGFGHRDAAAIVFGSAIVAESGFDESSRQVGLRHAMSHLYSDGHLEDVDGLRGKGFEQMRLSKKARIGRKALEDGWEWIVSVELEERQNGLLAFVNDASEQRETDHAWLKAVPIANVAASIPWASDSTLLEFEIEQLYRFHPDSLLRKTLSETGESSLTSTYDGLVWSTRQGEPRPLHDAFAMVEAVQQALRIGGKPDDFGFMVDEQLRATALADLSEAHRCFAVGAWKASALFSASVIEGLLYDAMSWPSIQGRPGFIGIVDSHTKNTRNKDGSVNWAQVSLTQLLAIAFDLGLIGPVVSSLVSGGRDIRNTIHPRAEIKLGRRASKHDASAIAAIVESVRASLAEI